MKVATQNEVTRAKFLATAARTACIASVAAAWILTAGAPRVCAQNAAQPSNQPARTGVSIPDNSALSTAPDPALTPSATARPAKPSAAIPAAQSSTVYGPYVPYTGPLTDGSTASMNRRSTAFDPDANIVTADTAGRDQYGLQNGPKKAANDPDANIVTYVPSMPGEVPDGTLLRARLRERLSTLTTRPGSRFTAEVSEPVMRDGRVIVPAGSVLDGRVTWVRGGRRIGGSAAIHIEPQRVTLPDGSEYYLRARVIDTNSWDNTKVDDEGTIMRSENKKRNAAIMGLTTGSGLAAGAMIGGVPGALIGAGVGAGISTVVWLQQDRQAVLPKDLGVVFTLTEPMSTTPSSATVAPMKTGASGGR